MKFILEFELTYKFNLSQEMLDLNDYDSVPIMVESYFGTRSESVINAERATETIDVFSEETILPSYVSEEETHIIPETTDDTSDYTISYSEPSEVDQHDEPDNNETLDFSTEENTHTENDEW